MSTANIDVILANAATIEHLRARVDQTFRKRDQSAGHREQWSRACAEFHQRYGELMYPGGYERWAAFLARDTSELDIAIAFLEVDPRFFRSGYMTETIWSRLKRAPLTSAQRKRVEVVALNYLAKRKGREFWYMVRYARMHGTEDFWSTVAKLAESQADHRAICAKWLLLARLNWPVQRWIANEINRGRYDSSYVPVLVFDPATRVC